jgi:hypothetical protein
VRRASIREALYGSLCYLGSTASFRLRAAILSSTGSLPHRVKNMREMVEPRAVAETRMAEAAADTVVVVEDVAGIDRVRYFARQVQ